VKKALSPIPGANATGKNSAGCNGRHCLFKSRLCQVPAVLLEKSDSERGSRKCLMETGSPSDSCAEECKAGGNGVVFSLFLKALYELIYCQRK